MFYMFLYNMFYMFCFINVLYVFICYFIVLDLPDEPNRETVCRGYFYSF